MKKEKEFKVDSDTPTDNHWQTIRSLTQYVWPMGRWDLKQRVIFAFAFLILSKIINIYVPFLLKLTIDEFSKVDERIVLPFALILSYGVARVLVQAFGELRDVIFSNVAQSAQRRIALKTFQHLHQLSLAFHLSRQTGGLSRIIERGTRAIQFVLHFTTFNIIPTIIEILLVTGVLLYKYHYSYALVIFATIVVYIATTLLITEWRLQHRKTMNAEESRANTKAIDSLLNYETVKYFGNEEHEYRRFDASLAMFEKAAIKNQSSLSTLNVAQSAIIGLGLVAVMLLASRDVMAHKVSIGDFVLVNTFLIQLYLPLNFLGFVYREIKHSLIDMDKMFELLKVHSSLEDTENAQKS
jgi:ATP-binding cassette subfamily B protein